MSIAFSSRIYESALVAMGDDAVWTHDYEKTDVRGFLVTNHKSELDPDIRVMAPYFHARTVDLPGAKVGDTILCAGRLFDVTKVVPAEAPDEQYLQLRPRP